MFDAGYFGLVVLVLAIAFAASMLRVLREYERGVVFMLGRFYKVKGPGLIIVIPVLQQMVRVDLRTVVMDVPPRMSSHGTTCQSRLTRCCTSG